MIVKSFPDDARLDFLRIAETAGLVDLLAGQAEVSDSWDRNRAFSAGTLAAAQRPSYFTPHLGRIVLVGEPLLRQRLNLQRVSLRTVHSNAGVRCGCDPPKDPASTRPAPAAADFSFLGYAARINGAPRASLSGATHACSAP